MTEPDGATNNTAEPGSTVGIQAEQVHNSTVYQLLPDASPRQKYEVGVRFLEHGVPSRARELINEAIARGHEDGEVRFHWVLAMLSKRSYRDLTFEEREQLRRTSSVLDQYADDEWKRALQVVSGLLDNLIASGSDPGLALAELRALQPRQRDQIVRHLDLVLTGELKDNLWTDTRQAAKRDRLSKDRLRRVWAYFEPDPIGPRVREPAEDSTTPGDRFWAVTWSGLFVIAVGYLGWAVLVHATPLPILAYLLALGSGYVGARNGLEWRYRAERLKVKDRDYFGLQRVNQAPEGGFASRVDHSFTHYFAIYVPDGVDREVWLTHTAGIRRTLRDEIVDLYRESRIGVDRVNWLIRHMVNNVKKRWRAGTLLEHREQYRIESVTKVRCVLSLTTLLFATVSVIVAAIQTSPFLAAIATLVALATGRVATLWWVHIINEQRWFAEDLRECKQISEERQTAYQRWKERLNSTRPAEDEMETWLNCDKTLLLEDALRRYRLAWRDIIAYAFLQTPAKNYKRARVRGGPWRYSKYDIRLFLITQDGVREISTELDFERAAFNGQERNNFRFDAVSSVHVTQTGDLGYTLGLTLTNGPTRNIRVTDPEGYQSDSSESPDAFSKINLDAAGFAHTLHILEGIAAEGKGWIDPRPHTNGNFDDLTPLTDATLRKIP
jgi:hypothetical protein